MNRQSESLERWLGAMVLALAAAFVTTVAAAVFLCGFAFGRLCLAPLLGWLL